jgi:mono/diheme cytochrome c family protein
VHERARRHAFRGTGLIALGLAMVVAAAGCGSNGDAAAPQAGGGGDGAAVYAARCASCHGGELQGTDRGPSHLSSVYKPGHHSDASFRQAILRGSPQHHWSFGAMPPVEGMSEGDITAVIAYIRAQQQARGFKD